MGTLRKNLEAAKYFIEPALRRTHSSQDGVSAEPIISCLTARLPEKQHNQTGHARRRSVLLYAVELLLAISNVTNDDNDEIWEPSSVEILYAILDLIMREGILPFFSPGVGLPEQARPKSLLADHITTCGSEDPDIYIEVMVHLAPLLQHRSRPVAAMLRERYLPDFIAILAEIIHGPSMPMQGELDWGSLLDKIVQETPSAKLLSALTILINPNTPDWLRRILSKYLSMIPLRPYGVRQTIEFIASSFPGSHDANQPHPENVSHRPPLPLEALTQAATVLSRVPSTMSDEDYFSALAPQLWGLVDGQNGADLSKAAGYIICAILSRKSTGAPGSAGWSCFAAPLIKCIDPQSLSPTAAQISTGLESTLVSEQALMRALLRTERVLQSQLNPGVVTRIIGPSVMSLWALAAFIRNRTMENASVWFHSPLAILSILFRLTTKTASYLKMIVNDILYDGREIWVFAAGSEGGVEIRARSREKLEPDMPRSPSIQLDRFEIRTQLFLDLLKTAHIDTHEVMDLFLVLTKKWLVPEQPSARQLGNLLDHDVRHTHQRITSALLVPKILDAYKNSFSRHPIKILKLGEQLLEQFTIPMQNDERNAKPPSYLALESISGGARGISSQTHQKVDEEIVSLALSLFTSLVSSSGFQPDDSTNALLHSVCKTLATLKTIPTLTSSLKLAVDSLYMLLNMFSPTTLDHPQRQILEERQNLFAAQDTFAQSVLPPHERLQALATITTFTSSRSAAIDVPTLTLLLLKIIMTEADEAIYLAAITSLAEIGRMNQGIAVRLILDAFLDEAEDNLSSETDVSAVDARLRVGEVLIRVIEDESEKNGQISRLLADDAIKVASRRGVRPKTLLLKQKKKRIEEKKQKRVGRAGDPHFEFETQPPLEDEAEETQKMRPEDRELIEDIVQGWEGEGLDEDVRIRVTALSILSQALVHHWRSLMKITIESIVDLVLSVLTLEKSPEKAILRRAAALVVMSLLKAIDATGGTAIILEPRQWDDIERVITRTMDMDEDSVVREHAREVHESLANWRMNVLFSLNISNAGFAGPGIGHEGRLKGINVNIQAENSGVTEKTLIEELD